MQGTWRPALALLAWALLLSSPANADDPIAIQGTLTDRNTHAPIANVQVMTSAAGAPLTTTDGNGSYWLTGSELNGQSAGTLYFRTLGYYVSTVSFDVTAGPETLEATLAPGGAVIQGTVRDANSQAGVAGARLTFRFACNAGDDQQCSIAQDGAAATSVSGGQYSIDSSQLLDTGRAGLQISYESASAVRYVDQVDSGLTIPVTDPLPLQRNFNLKLSQSIAFEDATARSKINFIGRSFGASWGDFDEDGWPDVYTGNHSKLGSLWMNNRDGTFTNVFPDHWTNPSTPDKHGAAFGDFDNDGDQDIMEVSGAGEGTGSSPNLLMVNNGGVVTNQAVAHGVDLPLGRGRTPLWLDWNSDGMLDMFISNLSRPDGQAPSGLYLQSNGAFKIQTLAALPPKLNSLFAQSSQLLGDGRRMLIIHSSDGYPGPIFAFGASPTVNLRTALKLPLIANVRDVAIEDFNGDLLPDFYLATLDGSAPDAVLTDSRTLKIAFNLTNTERGVNFICACDLTFTLGPSWEITPSKVYIGAGGAHPTSNTFNVSASNSASGGMVPHTPGSGFALYIGYDVVTQTWSVRATKAGRFALNAMVNSTADITNLVLVNINPDTLAIADRLFLNTGKGSFVDASNQPALTAKTACESVAAGDFDNDMDVDVYLVCRGQATNLPNILLENDGTGKFTVVPFAGGAEGSTLGRGDSVSVADYDNDGFLDLFVTNGNGEIPYTNGPYQLFHNLGNSNHWLELSLQGVRSNRDGVGARVIVTAGGKSQMREQNGAVHRISQNSQRLHFGLAGNTVVTSVTVYWPSGAVQTLNGIAADQILKITEGAP